MFTNFLSKKILTGGLLLGNGYFMNKWLKRKTGVAEVKCCGIVGYIGKKKDANEVLLNGVDLL